MTLLADDRSCPYDLIVNIPDDLDPGFFRVKSSFVEKTANLLTDSASITFRLIYDNALHFILLSKILFKKSYLVQRHKLQVSTQQFPVFCLFKQDIGL
jgi:hypothetical protein